MEYFTYHASSGCPPCIYLNGMFHLPCVHKILPRISEQMFHYAFKGFPLRISEWNNSLTIHSLGFPPRIAERDVSLTMRLMGFLLRYLNRMFHLGMHSLGFRRRISERDVSLPCVQWIYLVEYMNNVFHLPCVQWIFLCRWPISWGSWIFDKECWTY